MPNRGERKPITKAAREKQRLLMDIAEAQEDLKAAEAKHEEVARRTPFVRRLAAELQSQKRENHFGADFQITLVPRRPS